VTITEFFGLWPTPSDAQETFFDQIWTNQNKDELQDETKSCAKHFCVPIMCHASRGDEQCTPSDQSLCSKTQKV